MSNSIAAPSKLPLISSASIRVAVVVAIVLAGSTVSAMAAGVVEVRPGESIQAAIDDPDTEDDAHIVLAPGVYRERIDLRGRPLTVRSVDPLKADIVSATIIDGQNGGSVITCISGEGPDTIIAGLTIVGGQADSGGGMYIEASSPTVVACRFLDNRAAFDGAGIFVLDGAPVIMNCLFVGGESYYGAGIAGILSTALVSGCVFTGNDAFNTGGAIDNFNGSDATIVGCTFSANSADRGGAIANERSSPLLANSVLWGNFAHVEGHEIANRDGSVPWVRHCDVAGSGGSGAWDPALGDDGGGNIDADPGFVDASGADGSAGTADDDLRPGAGSPAIDAGRNADIGVDVADLDGDGDVEEPAPYDAWAAVRLRDDPATLDTGDGEAPLVDMGAHEFQPTETCPGDLDGNGSVGARDLALLIAAWGACDRCYEDIDGSGRVDFRDLLAMLVRWGDC